MLDTISTFWNERSIKIKGIPNRTARFEATGNSLTILFDKANINLPSDNSPNEAKFEIVASGVADVSAKDTFVGFKAMLRAAVHKPKKASVLLIAQLNGTDLVLEREAIEEVDGNLDPPVTLYATSFKQKHTKKGTLYRLNLRVVVVATRGFKADQVLVHSNAIDLAGLRFTIKCDKESRAIHRTTNTAARYP